MNAQYLTFPRVRGHLSMPTSFVCRLKCLSLKRHLPKLTEWSTRHTLPWTRMVLAQFWLERLESQSIRWMDLLTVTSLLIGLPRFMLLTRMERLLRWSHLIQLASLKLRWILILPRVQLRCKLMPGAVSIYQYCCWTFFSKLISLYISSSLVSLCFFADIHGLYEGPVTEVGATKEAADADETTVTVLGDGSNSGTTAAVSLSVIAIASAVTLTALKM